jgi:hypothetical protein
MLIDRDVSSAKPTVPRLGIRRAVRVRVQGLLISHCGREDSRGAELPIAIAMPPSGALYFRRSFIDGNLARQLMTRPSPLENPLVPGLRRALPCQ